MYEIFLLTKKVSSFHLEMIALVVVVVVRPYLQCASVSVCVFSFCGPMTASKPWPATRCVCAGPAQTFHTHSHKGTDPIIMADREGRRVYRYAILSKKF